VQKTEFSFKGGNALGSLAAFAAIGIALWVVSTHNFLLFHVLAELFSVVVAFAAFVVAWHSRRWIGRNYLLVLGFGYLYIGGIDVVHALAYKGMGVFVGHGGNMSSQLWLAARGFEVCVFLVALGMPHRRYHPAGLFVTFTIITAALVGTVFAGLWPATFIEGEGVTPFKVGFEFLVSGLYIGGLLLLNRRHAEFDPQIRRLLVMAVAAKAVTELAFTSYVDVYGLANFVGHVLKIGSCWLILKAIVEIGLRRPQALVFGARDRERMLSEEVARHATTLDAVLDSTLDPVAMVDSDCRFRFVSRAAESFFGRTSRELAGKSWREAGLAPEAMQPLADVCARVHETSRPVTVEMAMPGPLGLRRFEVQASPVAGPESLVEAVVVVIRDISVRKAMEEDLVASLADNRVLMTEVHHRVRNNLQIVSSILQMQGWRVTDPAMRGQFEEACGRILSLAKVHEMLYKQESPSSIDFVEYVRSLCDEIFEMYGVREDWIGLAIEAGSLPLPLDMAVPLALIVHELVINAVKTSFKEKSGQLHIRIAPDGADEGVLMIADTGIGRSMADFEAAEAPLGLRMVAVLVKQVHGSLDIDESGDIHIRFPLARTAADPLREAVGA
jgi:PAS domain S-box-containing protein